MKTLYESVLDIGGTQTQTESEMMKMKIENWMIEHVHPFCEHPKNSKNHRTWWLRFKPEDFFTINDDLTIDWIRHIEMIFEKGTVVPAWIKFNKCTRFRTTTYADSGSLEFESDKSYPKSVVSLKLNGQKPIRNWKFEWVDSEWESSLFQIVGDKFGGFKNCECTINTNNRFPKHTCDCIFLSNSNEDLSIFEGLKIKAPKTERLVVCIGGDNNYLARYNSSDLVDNLNEQEISEVDQKKFNKWFKGFPEWTEISIGYYSNIRRYPDGKWRLCNGQKTMSGWEAQHLR